MEQTYEELHWLCSSHSSPKCPISISLFTVRASLLEIELHKKERLQTLSKDCSGERINSRSMGFSKFVNLRKFWELKVGYEELLTEIRLGTLKMWLKNNRRLRKCDGSESFWLGFCACSLLIQDVMERLNPYWCTSLLSWNMEQNYPPRKHSWNKFRVL